MEVRKVPVAAPRLRPAYPNLLPVGPSTLRFYGCGLRPIGELDKTYCNQASERVEGWTKAKATGMVVSDQTSLWNGTAGDDCRILDRFRCCWTGWSERYETATDLNSLVSK
jgi:hypothetical protein